MPHPAPMLHPQTLFAVLLHCLPGICTNERCEAYNQCVVVNLGFRDFDLILDAGDRWEPLHAM